MVVVVCVCAYDMGVEGGTGRGVEDACGMHRGTGK